jgi:hypothetical protein
LALGDAEVAPAAVVIATAAFVVVAVAAVLHDVVDVASKVESASVELFETMSAVRTYMKS